ncbi:MAG TPA: ribonuclease HI family protein [Candidatus Methylomirabilis sp.]|jgi:ribonuclease HI
MMAGRHGPLLRRLALAARRGALGPLPAGITADEAAAALDAGADALGAPPADAAPPAAGPHREAAPTGGLVRIHVDGAARGNPGPAGFGVILDAGPDGPRIVHGGYLGEATNNVAEYQALLWALAEARRRGFGAVEVRSDSELMVKQMRGEYRVKHPRLRGLHARAAALARAFRAFSIRHVPREENGEADALANRAIDEGRGGRAGRRSGAGAEGA